MTKSSIEISNDNSGDLKIENSNKLDWHSDQRVRLTEIISGTDIGTWEWNIVTGETYFNRRWAEIVGYTLEELEPISIKTWLDLAHPDDLGKSNELLEKNFSGELSVYDFETRMRHKNNSWVWVHDRGKVVEWTSDGKPLRMAGTHSDITQKKIREQKIEKNQARLKAILENVEEGIFTCDENGVIDTVNNMACSILGYTDEELVGMNLRQLMTTVTVNQYMDSISSFLKSTQIASANNSRKLVAKKKDGSTLSIEFRSTEVSLQSGTLFVNIMRDLTEINAQRNFAETILNRNAAVILTLDIGAKVQTASEAWSANFGYSLEETLGKEFSLFLTEESALKYNQTDYETTPNQLTKRHTVETVDIITKDHEIRIAELHSAVDYTTSQIHKIITIIDVTETVQQRKTLLDLTERDELTRLYSRRGFYKYMADGVRTYSVALLLMDIDHFKSINDAFGHLIGDEYLKKIAVKLSSILGEDGLVARFGGEEFLLTFPADNWVEVRNVAEKARLAIEKFQLETNHGPVMRTVSSGAALLEIEGKVSQALGRADMALGHAKICGRNQAVIADSNFINWLEQAGKLITLEEVRKALENDEFELWLQPLMNLENKSTMGYEALMRWRRPDGQVLLPSVFLDKLQSVFKEPSYAHFRSKIIRHLLAQTDFSQSYYISINIQMEDLGFENAAGSIISVIGCDDNQKKSIVLEISEDAWTSRSDIDKVVKQIKILKSQGFRIALDDFGKASSNLLRLTKLPIDIVKLDKSLIADVVKDKKSRLAVRGITSIAKEMGMAVVAEGVEIEQQAEFLLEENITTHQGFLYSRAKHPKDIL
jgi:diguanylate cyclase (GGDEF)-like protein/PAS domain S-box-containing protein